MIVLVSTTHPDELPKQCADAALWKSQLAPRVLDELWLRHRGA